MRVLVLHGSFVLKYHQTQLKASLAPGRRRTGWRPRLRGFWSLRQPQMGRCMAALFLALIGWGGGEAPRRNTFFVPSSSPNANMETCFIQTWKHFAMETTNDGYLLARKHGNAMECSLWLILALTFRTGAPWGDVVVV